jgi:hypothetical protein
MLPERTLPNQIRSLCDAARGRVRVFTGLYSDEDIADEVLSTCDEVQVLAGTSPRLVELRQVLEARCQTLAEVTNRFSARDLAVIAAARMQVVVAIDQLQDAALEHLKAETSPGQSGLLRRRSI